MPGAPALEPNYSAERQERHPDRAVAALAGRQHGVVGRAQLAGLGLTRHQISRRLQCGRLHPVHRGVYAVGHRILSGEGRWMAAVLACGREAVLSHRSAAALWGLRGPPSGPVDVSSPRALRSRPTIRAHHSSTPADERTAVDGIPVTSPFRTLLDLAEVATPRELERALSEAEVRRIGDPVPMSSLLDRHAGRCGVARLRHLLDRGGTEPSFTRSRLEQRFLALVDTHGLPRPAVNAPITLEDDFVEADAVWRDHALVVELDSWTFHATRAAFERDRARDRSLQAAGWRVLRVTRRQLVEEPDTVAGQLRIMLATSARPGYRKPP